MRKYIIGLSLAFIGIVLSISVVLALAYSATVSITNSGSAISMYPFLFSENVTQLVDGHYITATGLDTRVLSGSTELPHMLSEDKLLFVGDVPVGDSVYLFETGQTALSSFPIITGYNGYVTIPANITLDLGDDFSISTKGYIPVDTPGAVIIRNGEFSSGSSITISVTDTSGSARTNVPVLTGIATQDLIDLGYVSDVHEMYVTDSELNELLFMPADNEFAFIIPYLDAYEELIFEIHCSGGDSETFPIIVGSNGSILSSPGSTQGEDWCITYSGNIPAITDYGIVYFYNNHNTIQLYDDNGTVYLNYYLLVGNSPIENHNLGTTVVYDSSDTKFGQTFTTESGYDQIIDGITVVVYKTGSPTGTMFATLYSLDELGLPDSILDYSYGVDNPSTAQYYFNFYSHPIVSQDTEYGIVIEVNYTYHSVSDYYSLAEDSGHNYAYGNLIYDTGLGWQSDINNDLWFEIYSESVDSIELSTIVNDDGDHLIEVYVDEFSYLCLDIDGSTEDSADITGYEVWTGWGTEFISSDVPYAYMYYFYGGISPEMDYEPDEMIEDDTIVDLDLLDDATISWGNNVDLDVDVGSYGMSGNFATFVSSENSVTSVINTTTVTANNVSPTDIFTTTLTDGTLSIYANAILKDSTAFGGTASTGSDNWTLMEYIPYLDYAVITIDDVEVLRYEPITYIEGVTLPDIDGTQDGIITWGENLGTITGSIGGFTPISSANITGINPDILPAIGVDYTDNGSAPMQKAAVANVAGVSPLMAVWCDMWGFDTDNIGWVFLALVTVIFIFWLIAWKLDHLGYAMVAASIVIAFFSIPAIGVLPWGMLFFSALALASGIVQEVRA